MNGRDLSTAKVVTVAGALGGVVAGAALGALDRQSELLLWLAAGILGLYLLGELQ